MEETDEEEFGLLTQLPRARRALAYEAAGHPRTGLTVRASWEPSPPEVPGTQERIQPWFSQLTRNLYLQQDFTSPT